MTIPRILISAVSALACAACTVGPDYREPDVSLLTPDALSTDPALRTETLEPANDWWRAFNDPELDRWIARALEQNRDLRVAAANVLASRAFLKFERTNLRPTGEAGAAYERRRLAGAAFGADDVSFDDSNFYTVELASSWELDFFGRVRRLTEAALADLSASEALYRDAQVLVIADTASAYVDWRGAALQYDVARRNLDNQRATLEFTQIRLEEGVGTRLDVARAAAQVKTTEAALPEFEALRVAAANRLATLTAQPVAAIETVAVNLERDAGASLPVLPESLAIGDVETLLRRRPDVRAADRLVAAATARVGVAKADYFPRVTLTGAASLSSQNFSGLDDSGAFGYGIGPQLVWTALDFPRVEARVTQSRANLEAAYAAYEQTVLLVLQETQTAISNHGREITRLEALSEAARQSSDAASLARLRFEDGADDFLDVLDAESRLLAAEAAEAQSRIAALRSFIDVYRSLGAGAQVIPAPQSDEALR